MTSIYIFALLSLAVVFLFVFRTELLQLAEGFALRYLILINIFLGRSSFADLLDTGAHRIRSRDRAVEFFDSHIASHESRMFMVRHSPRNHPHFVRLWYVGDKFYDYDVASGTIVIAHKQFTLPSSVEEAVNALWEHYPLYDPYFTTVKRVASAKYLVKDHNDGRHYSRFHEKGAKHQ